MAGTFDGSNEERTETASPYRREEFRKQGTVAMSREVLSVAILLAVGGAVSTMGGHFQSQFALIVQKFFNFSRVDSFNKTQFIDMNNEIIRSWAMMVWPILLVAVIVAIIASVAQVGFHVTWDPLTPKWERINPVAGFSRLFGGKGVMEAVKATIKLGIVLTVLYFFFKTEMPQVAFLFQKSVPEVTAVTTSVVRHVFFVALISLGVLAGLDYFYQRYTVEKQMKMTRREVKEEFKMREGDPLIKSRIRGIQRRIANRRMMEAVPKADVIVTNPTHFAVALQYDSKTMFAPKVVAKGVDNMAKKIREVAKFHRIPIVENKPLARTLYKEIEINHYVPRELYKAVAEVLAYVYRLKASRGIYG